MEHFGPFEHGKTKSECFSQNKNEENLDLIFKIEI
jgi:hypothetical protein